MLMETYVPPVQGGTRRCAEHSPSPSPLALDSRSCSQHVFWMWDPTGLLWAEQGPRVLELELGDRELLTLP